MKSIDFLNMLEASMTAAGVCDEDGMFMFCQFMDCEPCEVGDVVAEFIIDDVIEEIP